MSKIGAANVRKALYLPAIVAKNKNESFQNLVEKQQKLGRKIYCWHNYEKAYAHNRMLKNDQDATLAFAVNIETRL